MAEEENKEIKKSLVDKANEAAKRLEEANKKHEELLAKEETLRVERILAGKADAVAEKPKEESPEEYTRRVMNGGI